MTDKKKNSNNPWLLIGAVLLVFIGAVYFSGTGIDEQQTLTIRPNGVGTYSELTDRPLFGANWEKVNEVINDGDSTYNTGLFLTDTKDSYHLQDHTSESGTINSVTVNGVMGKTSWSHAEAFFTLRTHSTDYQDAGREIPARPFSTYSNTWNTNPYTGKQWTWDEIDDLEAGVRFKIGNSNGQITQLFVTVEHNEGVIPFVYKKIV